MPILMLLQRMQDVLTEAPHRPARPHAQLAFARMLAWLTLAGCCAVTHSHLDHSGAIEPLKKVYPDLKVILHETEAPYLIGSTDYSCYDHLPGGLSTGFKLLMWLRFIPPFYQYKVQHALKLIRLHSTVTAYIALRSV